jgi:2-C-methyl-D-erythritol 4-phosphate cytidylyltransferase
MQRPADSRIASMTQSVTLPSGIVPRAFALVPCAGVGQRAAAGGPKQYALLNARAVVAHTLEALAAVTRLQATLVVLAPDDTVFERWVPAFAGERGWVERRGGDTRAATVGNGLRALRERGVAEHDWVLVHDAARCLVRPEWVDRLIDACANDDVGGLLALPVADTLKREQGERVVSTLDRRHLWSAQTPQMFRLGLLERALAHAGDAVTDESSAIEALGLLPRLVPGELENLKVTWPADLALAARLLESR